MPSKDAVAKEFFNRPGIIADICNQIIFRGKGLVRPEDVLPMPTELTAAPPGGTHPDGGVRLRDSLHRIRYVHNGRRRTFRLGLEFQSSGNRNMLFRPMDYDGRSYTAMLARGAAREEVQPIVTLVFSLADRPWRHPCSLKERFRESTGDAVLEFLNYRMNLVDPFTLDENIIGGMCPELKTVIHCFRFSNDRESLEAVLSSAPDGALSREAVDMLNAYLDFDLTLPAKEEGTQMCKAVREWKRMLFRQGFREGQAKGEKKGIAKGEKKGKTEGIAEGMAEGIAKIIRSMLQRNIPAEQVHELTGLPMERILAIAAGR